MWKEFNNNPCGRNVDDCAVRAVSVALDKSWEQAYRILADNGLQMCDMPNANSVWGATLRKHGFYRGAVPNTCPDCYTAGDFIDDHPYGIYVLGFGTHVATAVDGILLDSFNSLDEIPQYFWYRG